AAAGPGLECFILDNSALRGPGRGGARAGPGARRATPVLLHGGAARGQYGFVCGQRGAGRRELGLVAHAGGGHCGAGGAGRGRHAAGGTGLASAGAGAAHRYQGQQKRPRWPAVGREPRTVFHAHRLELYCGGGVLCIIP
nr:hypothetical protein [Tanacetum cinerariifolium]